MQNYIVIHFREVNSEQQDLLVAQLNEIGFEGFEQTPTSLAAFIPESAFNEDALKAVTGNHSGAFTKEIIHQQNWNDVWEKSFEPVIIGNFCSIRAAFHPPIHHTQHDIVITPKMSFGTGHHATTFLMVKIMQTLELREKNVLDFGTGTGILAILAEQCGARTITAIDNDEWSINNAVENISANQCTRIEVQLVDSIQVPWAFDVILANINKHVITQQLADIAQHLKDDGVLVISGLLQSDRDAIVQKVALHQLKVLEVIEEKEWIALTCRH